MRPLRTLAGISPIPWVTLGGGGLRTAGLDWPRADRSATDPNLDFECESRPWARDRWLVDALIHLLDRPVDLRPDLALLYMGAVDAAGHDEGVEGPAIRRTIHRADRVAEALHEELVGLEGDFHLIVTSDHGLVPRGPEPPVLLDEYLDLSSFRLVTSGAYSALWLRRDEAGNEAGFRRLKNADRPVRVFEEHEIPVEWRYRGGPRTPNYLVVAEPGAVVGTRAGLADHRAIHGYPPSVPDMSGVLLAAGPRIRQGSRIPAASVVDVHALALELLDLPEREGSDGSLVPFASALCRSPCDDEPDRPHPDGE